MSISFTCPHCGLSTTVAQQYAGKSGLCAGCGQAITVPTDAPAPESPDEQRRYHTNRRQFKLFLIAVPIATCTILLLLVAVQWMRPTVQVAQANLQRRSCQGRMQRISQALRAYHDQYGQLPPAYSTDSQGRPLHSWRVLILPFLDDQSRQLYQQLDLNQPWNTPPNTFAHNRMPSVFGCPTDPNASMGETSYCLLTGSRGVFDGSQVASLNSVSAGDGLANTVLVIEAAESGIVWMEPRDIPATNIAYGINSEQEGSVRSWHPGGVFAAMADGRILFLPNELSANDLLALMTANGGEPMPEVASP